MKRFLCPLFTFTAILLFQPGCESSRQVKPLSHTITTTPVFQGVYIESANADQKPKAVKRTAPVYPFELKRKGISGYAKLVFVIDVTGKPTQIQAVQASKQEFIGPAIDSLTEWRFKPAQKNGQPIACVAEQVFEFHVTNR
ncbi:MAG: energy transducer TonB [Nibricoccus sp.]